MRNKYQTNQMNLNMQNTNNYIPSDKELLTNKRGHRIPLVELKGEIIKKKKIENTTGIYVDGFYYELVVRIDWPEDKKYIKKLLAFKEKMLRHGQEVSPLWKSIEDYSFIGKQYIFRCSRYMQSFRLVDWQEFDPNSK